MKCKTVIEYTSSEINTIVNTLGILSDIFDEETASLDVKQEADQAFKSLSTLLLLSPEGEEEFHANGW